ncbi:3-hydroxyacyl-CoA dehydrogenase family protein [Pedobacter sp. MC2016-24]|uniref:3-hydroxyacyl-CoA dehydrogenase family protein n=1 Tax=Pedobacter sp. MC2016-24 TaxID=2780090 RepID=UPI0018818294|nr:3-hydroxyacyl-CoA dehydrogenase family protein [Pedobacter sp. MC2016-24]MBE9601882.1 3-hydroxyacyl-CoA dehydrogenase family protein [Pedobacter sp. MC2016-24]
MKRSEKLTVIGCGTMGHSIVLNAAWAGLPVTMYGLNAEETTTGLAGIMAKLDVLVNGELIKQAEIPSIMQRITTSYTLNEAVSNTSFIIEAIPENLQLKQELFKSLENVCGADVVFASNTSGLVPSQIAEGLVHSERFIVLHFWNPAHLVPLVEVVGAANTSDVTRQRSIDLLQQMRKKPVVVKKEIMGFIGNRLQAALLREALHLLEQCVASKEDIDAAVTYSIGRRLPVTGPLASADMGGLDVFAAISDYLFKDLSNASEAPQILKNLVAENRLGQKTKQGFYPWDNEFTESMNRKRELALIGFLKQDQQA